MSNPIKGRFSQFIQFKILLKTYSSNNTLGERISDNNTIYNDDKIFISYKIIHHVYTKFITITTHFKHKLLTTFGNHSKVDINS